MIEGKGEGEEAEKEERSEKKGDVACGHTEGADAANSHSWVKDPSATPCSPHLMATQGHHYRP